MVEDEFQTVSDVNIEVAHVYFDHQTLRQFTDEVWYHIEQSAALARQQLQAVESAGGMACVSLLVDDQPFGGNGSHKLFDPFVEAVSQRIELDYVCYESRLAGSFKNVLTHLKNPRRIRREVYRQYDGVPQCSHNIATWHMMRLGYIARTGAVQTVSQTARQGGRPFVARKAMSIVSERHRPQEVKAARRMLGRTRHPDLLEQVELVYYPDP